MAWSSISNLVRIGWALPNTLIGLAFGTVCLCFGGRVQIRGRAIEFYDGGVTWLIHRLPDGQFVLALTLGHVILGQSSAALDIARDHETVHVRQYERWGPFMLPAYLASSLRMWMTGRRFYRDNMFDREAYGE